MGVSFCREIRYLHFQSIFVLNYSIRRGRARTQVPTTRNYTLELPTFGVIAGVNPIEVQWEDLAPGGPPWWSRCLPRQVSMPDSGRKSRPLGQLSNRACGMSVNIPDGPSKMWLWPQLRGGKPADNLEKNRKKFQFGLFSFPGGNGPYSEVVLYRDNPWLGGGKPLSAAEFQKSV